MARTSVDSRNTECSTSSDNVCSHRVSAVVGFRGNTERRQTPYAPHSLTAMRQFLGSSASARKRLASIWQVDLSLLVKRPRSKTKKSLCPPSSPFYYELPRAADTGAGPCFPPSRERGRECRCCCCCSSCHWVRSRRARVRTSLSLLSMLTANNRTPGMISLRM